MTADIVEKIVALDEALTAHGVAHAFGGALALAWCTARARGTIDIDLNVFVPVDQASAVCATLPTGIAWTEEDVTTLTRDGQARVHWGPVPVDIFLNTTVFHDALANRTRWEEFDGRRVPFLSCTDLAVFKVFFNRSRDWADLEEMIIFGSVDVEVVLGVLVRHLGVHDERVDRLGKLATRLADEP